VKYFCHITESSEDIELSEGVIKSRNSKADSQYYGKRKRTE
jgi:hypothetical protein